jgi:hypothetical protein
VPKYWMSGEKSAQEGREARLRSLKTLFGGCGSSGIGADCQIDEKISDALHTGGILLQWATYEPGVVPGNPKWGIPVDRRDIDFGTPRR